MKKEDFFHIYVDRLKKGLVQKIQGPIPPAFLDVEEPELQFYAPVEVEGKAYATEDHLILQLTASARAKMPCSMCNQMIETMLKVKDFTHTIPLPEIPGGIYNFSDLLREALLIELPHYVECQKGNCPERATLLPFLHAPAPQKEGDTYFPFSNLKL